MSGDQTPELDLSDKLAALDSRALDKRDLADDLLSGLEGAGALDLDELMGLLAD